MRQFETVRLLEGTLSAIEMFPVIFNPKKEDPSDPAPRLIVDNEAEFVLP